MSTNLSFSLVRMKSDSVSKSLWAETAAAIVAFLDVVTSQAGQGV